jgi:hypothetical protein
MNAAQYKAALARLGLSQRGAAVFFDVDERTSRRWALGEQPPPRAVQIALELMLKYEVAPSEFLRPSSAA